MTDAGSQSGADHEFTPTPQTADELIEGHLPLCQHVLASVTARFPRHADREELAQAARLGLVEAAHRYDASRGVPFDRWAAVRIRGAILDAVRAVDFAPRALRSTIRDAENVREQLAHELGRTPTTAERAQRLGMSERQLSGLEGKAHRALVVSLDAGADRDTPSPTTSIASSLVDAHHPDPLVLLERVEQTTYIRDAVALLPERLRDVIVSYFLDGESSSSIAARLGVTESRVSQMRSEGLSLLRCAIAAQYGECAPSTPRHADFAQAVGRRSTFSGRVSLVPPIAQPDSAATAWPAASA